MSRPPLRALIAAASSASLLVFLLTPAGALAGRADRGSDHFVELNCDFLEGDGGTLFFGVALSDRNGPSAGLEAYAPGDPPFESTPSFVADFEQAPTGSFAGGVFSMEIPVVDGTGTPAGSATIEATLVPSGDREPFDDSFKDGNHKSRTTGTFLPYSVESGTATLPDGASFTLDNDHCFSDEISVTFFATNPTSFINQFSSNSVNCPLLSGDEQIGNLFVDVASDRSMAFVDVFFFDLEMEAFGDATIDSGHIAMDLSFSDLSTGDEIGPGALDMTLAATGTQFKYVLNGGTETRRVHGQAYDVEGSLTAPGLEPFDLGGCKLADQTTKRIVKPARAAKPTGRAPANDLPSRARPVASGTNLSQNTKNAALDAEEPYECLTFVDEEGNPDVIPVIKTVWYRFAGTGKPVTIDTKGTGFDTVVAVYTKAADGSYVPEPDACVDDVPVQPLGRTLQAAVTFDTAVGTTYYVQIGGFPDDLNWGSLHVRVS